MLVWFSMGVLSNYRYRYDAGIGLISRILNLFWA